MVGTGICDEFPKLLLKLSAGNLKQKLTATVIDAGIQELQIKELLLN